MKLAKYRVQLSTEKKYLSKYEYKYKYEYSIPAHKTYIPHIPAFVYLACFHSQSILQSDHFHGIIFHPVLCSSILFFSVYTNFNLKEYFQNISNISANFQKKKILQSDIFTAIFQHLLYFLEEMEPMLEIQNISIETDDDIIHICSGGMGGGG